jgi:hypothetical protein
VFFNFFGGFVSKVCLFEDGDVKAAIGNDGEGECFERTPVKRRGSEGLAMRGSPSVLKVLSPALDKRSSAPLFSSSDAGVFDNKKDFVSTPVKRRPSEGLAMRGSPSMFQVLSPALGKRSSAPLFSSSDRGVFDNKQDFVRTPVKRRDGEGLAMRGSPSMLQVLSPALDKRASPLCLYEVSHNSSSIQSDNRQNSCVANLFFSSPRDLGSSDIAVTSNDSGIVEIIQANNIR